MSASSGRGEFLGLISAFGGSISPAVVRVNEDSVFAVLFRADLQLLAKASPLAYGKLMHLFTCELAKLGAEFMARFAVMDRLTRGLQLELANHTPEDESNGEARDARAFIETFELR